MFFLKTPKALKLTQPSSETGQVKDVAVLKERPGKGEPVSKEVYVVAV